MATSTITGDGGAGPARGDAASRALRLPAGADVRRGLLAILDQGIVSGLSFATCSIVAVACGRFDLGVAHLVLTILVLMMNVQGELVNAPFTVYRARRSGDELAAYTGSALAHQAWLGVVGLGGLLVYLAVLSRGSGAAPLVSPVWALLFAAPFCLLHAFLRHLSFACFQFRVALAMDIAAAWLQLSVIVLLMFCDALTVPAVFLAMGLASAASCLGWFAVRPEPWRVVRGRLWGDWRTNWSFGRWSLSSHMIGRAMTYVLPWLLAAAHDEAATGTFAACSKLSALASTFVVGIAHFLTPKAVHAYAAGGLPALNRVLGAAACVFSASVGVFCLIVFSTGDLLMVTLFGADFAGTGAIAGLLSAAVLVNSLSVVAGNALWAIDRPQANLIGDSAALLTTLGVALWLVGDYGALGVAVAILVGGTVGGAARGATFWRYSRRLSATTVI